MADNSKVLKVMVSSTIVDLPKHREQVKEACLRQTTFPSMMEHRPASDDDAIKFSLDLVDGADIYIGVYGARYGWVPKDNNPKQISLTEMEYDRAVERGIPRLIFVMDKKHPVNFEDIEQGEGAIKLKTFLDKVKTDNFVNFFTSPKDLRTHVINSLAECRLKLAENTADDTPKSDHSSFHYVNDIPTPPEEYIAHPYTLLQTHSLVGRQKELNLLTDWVVKPDSEIYKAHILSIVAIGGMGKSALTWKWFEDIAPKEMKPLAGRIWWSFYESDASFENFIIQALAYVSKRPVEEISQMPLPDRESGLLATLDREPYLIVFDGLERILIAYTGMHAARLSDNDVESQKGKRKTIDPRIGQFLKKLMQVKKSRILISSRLFPAELETDGGDELPNVFKHGLEGLKEDDALGLWRAFGVSGSRDLLRPIFDSIGRHPLLIQALAGEVKRYKKAPADFEKWLEANPKFDPARYPKVQDAMSHVIEYALHDLGEKQEKVLDIIAAFRMPVSYETLTALITEVEDKLCDNETELDFILVELEDRGLVGWDRRANRYDLHPIVRGVVWGGLGDEARRGVYTSLHNHFEAVPMIDYQNVESLQDLTPAIELYNTLIGMERYNDALRFFYDRLSKAMLWRLSVSRQRIELVEMLFPDGLAQLPRVDTQGAQAFALLSLAGGYKFTGQLGRSVSFYRRANTIYSEMNNEENLGIALSNLAEALRLTGEFRESEECARRALTIAREQKDRFNEGIYLHWMGLTMGARGMSTESKFALERSLKIFAGRLHHQSEGLASSWLAQRAIWSGEAAVAMSLANRSWEMAHLAGNKKDFILAARMQGEAALRLNDLDVADERLHCALTRARRVDLIQEELATLTALAELRRRQGDEKAAREFLDDVWEFAERGPYPLLHADALNVLAQIERDAGNIEAAKEAATKAYKKAWCDGPPYAYHWGLEKAQKHLEELGAPLPSMPPFDESKYEPMPEVEIDPDDEFHVGDQDVKG